jgi:hypothetical protein
MTTATLPNPPTIIERIVTANNTTYTATNEIKKAAAEYRQAAGMAVQKGDWKLAVELDAKAQKLSDLSIKIYATMIGSE